MSFLLTGCAFNNDNPSTGGNNPPVEEVKETFIPKVGEVKMLFDDGTIGETNKYNYCPSYFIEDNILCSNYSFLKCWN